MKSTETEVFLISSAIVTVFAWLVPNVFIEISQYLLTLGETTSSYWKGVGNVKEGKKAVMRHSLIAIAVSLLTITATAITVSLTTRNLDSRMITILSGISRLVAAVCIFFLSYKIPKWLGVYHSVSHEYGKDIGTSIQVLSFNVRWAIYGHFFKIYFYLLPFYCGVSAATIPVSALIGIVAGFLIVLGVYVGRTKCKAHKSIFAIAFAILLNILSSIALASGCYFIQTVWGQQEENGLLLACVTFFCWLLIQLVCHFFLWKISKREFAAMKRRSLRSQGIPKYNTQLFDPKLLAKIHQDNSSVNNALPPIGEAVEGEISDDNIDVPEQVSASVNQNEANIAQNEKLGNVQVPCGDGANGEDADLETDKRLEAVPNFQEEDPPEKAIQDDGEKDLEPPTCCTLLRAKLCGCGCCCKKHKRLDYAEPREMSKLEKGLRISQLIFNGILSLFFLYLTIVNIGASVQVDAVNSQLNQTYEVLYPPSYNAGPVCALKFDGPDSNITTFASPQAANASGFVVLHCGECGSCSTWQNLDAYWKTRKTLASLSQNCGKKTLFGGYGKALQCHVDTIGFDESCSTCWVDDEICARNHCVFIFLQANLINNVGNFQVGPKTITSATCDEAMCGPGFVRCSGANRRRMNIVSDIARPLNQQCRNVQANWTELFG